MNIRLRELRPDDKDLYISLQREYWVNKKALDDVKMRNGLWQDLQEEKRINYVIAAPDGEFRGFCGVKNKYSDIPEIEIEILEKFTGQGMGYPAMCLLLKELMEKTGKTCFLTKVIPDNYPSIRLMQKCGAVPYRTETHALLTGEEAENFANRHSDLVSGEIVQLAHIFGVEKEELLSSVLLFHIDLENMEQEKFCLKWKKEGKFERRLEKEIMLYSLKSGLSRIEKIRKTAAEENAQKLNRMLEEYRNELEEKLKRLDEQAEY